jgi:Ca2+/Na+ antiporter
MMDKRRDWGRPLAVVAAILFAISSVFPVTAGLAKNTTSFSKWWGIADVAIAFFLVILVFWIMALVGKNVSHEVEGATYRAYRVLLHGILALVVVFFLFDGRIAWINCITGFAWRAWLLLYVLPYWLTAMRHMPGETEAANDAD